MELRAIDLGWRGRVDLMTLYDDEIEVVDYKTGEASNVHAEQLRLYALLWHLDTDLNPEGRLVTRLLLVYRGGVTVVPVPTLEELRDLEASLRLRSEHALALVRNVPPPAQPSVEVCRHCWVRHLCNVYWTAETQGMLSSPESPDRPRDAALQIQRRHGPSSWEARVESGGGLSAGQQVLVRGRLRDVTLEAVLDRRELVYVLDAYIGQASNDDSFPVVTLGASSEVFIAPRDEEQL